MLPALLAFTAFVSTLLGGLLALKNRERLHLVLGFTAGVLIGVVAFELLPEIFHLQEEAGIEDATLPMVGLVVGFLAFHIISKLTIIQTLRDTDAAADRHFHGHLHRQRHPKIGIASALALSAHSFLDGAAIGLAFQVNTSVGLAVALAVIAHDFSDGLNTVSLMLSHKNSPKRALGMLLLDAIAPVLGALSTLLFSLTPQQLVIYLGFFAGFLLYIGAADILPEAHADKPRKVTLLLTILGVAVMFIATRFHFE